jgi:hypothetical protein
MFSIFLSPSLWLYRLTRCNCPPPSHFLFFRSNFLITITPLNLIATPQLPHPPLQFSDADTKAIFNANQAIINAAADL